MRSNTKSVFSKPSSSVTFPKNVTINANDQDQVSSKDRGYKLFDNLKDDELLTTEQLAVRLNVAVRTIRKWRYEHVLPDHAMVKLRRQVRYRWAHVLLWLKIREE